MGTWWILGHLNQGESAAGSYCNAYNFDTAKVSNKSELLVPFNLSSEGRGGHSTTHEVYSR